VTVVGSTTKQAGSSSLDDCICPKSTFKKVESLEYPTCVEVPKGVNEAIDALEKSNLFLEKGFYRVFSDTLEILQCEMESACNGGEVTGDNLCEAGHTGKLCSVCEDNYATVGIGPMKSGEECEGSKTATLSVFGIALVGVFVAFLIIAYKEYNTDLEEGETIDQRRERGSSAAERVVEKAKKAKSAMAKIGPVVKILVSYSQIVYNFSSIFDMRFPPMFSWITGIFGALASLDFINFMPLDCVFASNYDQKMVVYTGLPVAFAALIGLVLLKLRSSKEDNHVHFSNWFFRLFLLATFAVLPSATLRISSK